MNIQTRYLDMALGVNAYFKISDPERFIIHYLTERQMLNTTVIVDELTDTIRNILQETLYVPVWPIFFCCGRNVTPS